MADVVDAARQEANVPVEWNPEPLKLGDVSDDRHQFFIRYQGDDQKAAEVFGDGGWMVSNLVEGEYGRITPVMTEREFEEKAAEFGELVNVIRLL